MWILTCIQGLLTTDQGLLGVYLRNPTDSNFSLGGKDFIGLGGMYAAWSECIRPTILSNNWCGGTKTNAVVIQKIYKKSKNTHSVYYYS
jgi:hypothetical protein